MAAIEWDEPGMKRNKNVRFRIGQGSNTVSYYPPQSALEVGRNPSGYNHNQLPALRQSGLPAVSSHGALPATVPPKTGFQMGAGGPVEVSSVARPTTPQLQIGYDGPKERISLGQVRQNLNKGKFVGPPAPEGYTAQQSQTALPNEGFVGPKNMGAFAPRTTFGGSHVVDPSGSLAGELYRNLSKSTGRYIPGLEQMWGGQPNADEWKQGTDEAYQQARSGLKIHPMNTQYKNHGMSATGFPSITAEQMEAIVGRQGVKDQDIVYGETPGSAIIKDAKTGKVLAKGSGEATGGFSRPSTWKENLAFEDAQYEQMRNISDRRRALDTQELQESLIHRASNGDKNALETLKASGHIRPNDFALQQFNQAQAAALPIATRSHTALEGAQADYYSGRNSTDRANSMYENYVKALVAGNKSSKALSATDWKALADLQMTNPEMYAKAMEYLKVQG